jgi:hypothetical protein
MPQAIAAVGTFFAAGTAVAVVVKTILINVALGALTKALTKKPKYTAPPVNISVKNTIENRRIILGKRRAGGVFVFYGTTSTGGSTKDLLWYVIVYAGHQCNDVQDIWLDTERIPDADINPTTGAVATAKFAGKLNIWRYNGTSGQTVNTELDSAFTEWTSDHRLRGCTYTVVKMQRDDAAFPNGAPQSVTALIEGALLYDSRLDSTNGGSGSHRRTDPSTWAYSTNPALAARWYLTGGSVHNDLTTRLVRYGLREIDSRINDAYFRSEANVCDETLSGANAPPSGTQKRYECNLEISTGEDRRTILEAILATMAGTVTYVQGQWRVHAGKYDTPLYSFTQNDLYGELESEDTTPHEARYNQVAAVYIDSSQQYVEQTTLFRTDAAYETQDGDEPIPREIDLRGVTDQYQAQRLAEIDLRKSRMMRTIKMRGARNLLKIAPNETFNLSHSRWSWSSRVFRCIEREFEFTEEAGRVVITARREDAGVYTDMVTADYSTGTSSTDVFTLDGPDAPTGLTATSLHGAVWLQWTDPTFKSGGRLIFEVWEYTAATPFASATKVWEGRANQAVINYVTPGTRYFWVRSKYPTGQVSATEPATNGLAGTPQTTFVAQGNCQIVGSIARKVGGASAWDSHVYSVEKYLDGCQVTFTPDQTNAHLMIGLNTDPTTDQDYASLDYAFYCENNGTLDIRESGVEVAANISGGYSTSTILTVRHDGRRIQYIKDGAIVRDIDVGTKALHMDSSFHTPSASVSHLYFGAANPVRPNPWIARGNCIAGVTTARKVGGSAAWDSDIYSVDSYTVCHVKCKPSQTNLQIMVGLNTDPITDSNWTSLDYAWHFDSDGTCGIRESGGSEIVDGGAYTTSTELAITYDATNIRYYKDLVLMRTELAAGLTLFADSSFHGVGGALNSLHFGPGTSLEQVGTPGIEGGAATDVYQSQEVGPVNIAAGTGSFDVDSLSFTAAADGDLVATATFDASKSGGANVQGFIRVMEDGVAVGGSNGAYLDGTLRSYAARAIVPIAAGASVEVKVMSKHSSGGSATYEYIEIEAEFIKR